jgi:hypothetical protein
MGSFVQIIISTLERDKEGRLDGKQHSKDFHALLKEQNALAKGDFAWIGQLLFITCKKQGTLFPCFFIFILIHKFMRTTQTIF